MIQIEPFNQIWVVSELRRWFVTTITSWFQTDMNDAGW